MQIYDISQELFSGEVFPGDLQPYRHQVCSISHGDTYNLSNVTMCVHNATHIDAPYHFLENGKAVDKVDLKKCIGEATVVEYDGVISSETIQTLSQTCHPRLLIKGNGIITLSAAKALVDNNFMLIGVAKQTIGEGEEINAVHEVLLKNEIVILEGLVLDHVSIGDYMLCAAPLKLANCDGSPCRAVLYR